MPRRHLRLHHLLLLLPFALLWVPFYNRIEPQLFGFPFFYWYQMIWIAITAGLTAAVYGMDRRVGGGP